MSLVSFTSRVLLSTLSLQALTASSAFALGPSLEERRAALEKEYASKQKATEDEKKKFEAEIQRIKAEEEKALAELDEQSTYWESELTWSPERCESIGDAIEQSQAEGRFNWTFKCIQEKIDLLKSQPHGVLNKSRMNSLLEMRKFLKDNIKGKAVTGRALYPTFGVVAEAMKETKDPKAINPLNYKAPVDPNAPCNIPDNYSIIGICVSGCYTGDQTLWFSTGVERIEVAYQTKTSSIMTLSKEADLGFPEFQSTPIETYIRSMTESQQEILTILTLTGKTLRVTPNHPMLMAKGTMVEARTLKTGDALINSDGQPELVADVYGKSYYGRVYNLFVKNSSPLENIVVAEGLLTGTAFYQNEGTVYLNRRLFRLNLPESLFE